MKRALFIVGALFAIAPATAGAAPALPDVYESNAVSGGLHVSIAVPAYFEIFGPYASAEATNGSSHSYEAPGYGGFFLTAAAEQFGFPPPPGTTETLYPQGPTQDETSGSFFTSSGRSTASGSSGQATVGRGGYPGFFDVTGGRAASEVRAMAEAVTAASSIAMQDVSLADGLVTIEQVVGRATSRSTGHAGEGSADGSITMTGVEVAGVPIEVRANGVTVAGTPLDAPAGAPLNDLLNVLGVRIERLPIRKTVDGRVSEISVGGFRFVFSQPQAEFTFTVTMGDLIARARVVDLPDADGIVEQRPTVMQPPPNPAPEVAVGASERVAEPVARPQAIETARTVVRRTPVGGADWIAIAALAAMAAPFALILRRAFRAALRP